MTIKTLMCGLLATTAFGAGVATATLSSSSKSKEEPKAVQALDEATVYYAISSSDVGSYSVKLNVNNGGYGWKTHDFSRVSDKTYTGLLIYSCTFPTPIDGVDTMQIQLHDQNGYVSQQQPYSSFVKADVFDGRMYVHNTGWTDYHYDVSYTIYMDIYEWSSLNVYVWDSTGNKTGDFPGVNVPFTDANLQFNGTGKMQSYSITALDDAKIKFSDNGDSYRNSGDQPLIDGAFYYSNSGWTYDEGDLAAAAKYVWDFNVARLAVTAYGNVKSWSICGLDLSSWLSEYNKLSAEAKAYVDAASIWTYTDASSSDADKRITYAEIVNYMEEQHAGGAKYFIKMNENTTYTIIGVIGVTTLITVIALAAFISKKRKLAR